MRLQFNLNGRNVSVEVAADAILLDVLRKQGCYSVKRGCDTANCGLCTVLMDNSGCCLTISEAIIPLGEFHRIVIISCSRFVK